jgi:phospholipid/cholesterol/gamma-HCH transport system ATP-binding protein
MNHKEPDILITLDNVYKSFEDKHVLKGLNLSVKKGETFVILGPSGCGKSVTIKLITGLLKPDAGHIYFDNHEISEYSEHQMAKLRKSFGMLFQNAALFDSLTVGENVAFGLKQNSNKTKSEIKDRVSFCLESVGLPGTENKMPSELSGGMRKRVGLARAIALEPEVIFYDEPTTGLDPIMATEIDRLVIKMQEQLNATSIVITHDLKSAFRIADRVGLHYHGQIWEVGTPDVFKQSNNPMVQQFIQGKHEGPIRT